MNKQELIKGNEQERTRCSRLQQVGFMGVALAIPLWLLVDPNLDMSKSRDLLERVTIATAGVSFAVLLLGLMFSFAVREDREEIELMPE